MYSKVYLGIITNSIELDNLRELTSVYDHFDGLAVSYHGSYHDQAYYLLDSRKKEGFVECIKYMGHHGHSMNHFLFNPKIKLGDWVLLRDSGERINPDFAANIKPFINHIQNLGINSVVQRSKLLLFRRFPQQFFASTPHWGFQGGRGKFIDIADGNWFPDDKDYCYSVRNETRDKYHFVDAFARYYLINDSNHCLLGAENFGDPKEVFIKLEGERLDFLLCLRELGIDNNIDALRQYFVDVGDFAKMLPEMQNFVNSNLILNQFYRYHIRSDLTVSPDLRAPIIKIV